MLDKPALHLIQISPNIENPTSTTIGPSANHFPKRALVTSPLKKRLGFASMILTAISTTKNTSMHGDKSRLEGGANVNQLIVLLKTQHPDSTTESQSKSIQHSELHINSTNCDHITSTWDSPRNIQAIPNNLASPVDASWTSKFILAILDQDTVTMFSNTLCDESVQVASHNGCMEASKLNCNPVNQFPTLLGFPGF